MTLVNGSNCYALAKLDQGQSIPDEFDPATLLAWSDRLTGLGACQAVVGLILKLEALSRVEMSGCDRALLLHLLEVPLQLVFKSRPRLTPVAVRTMMRKDWGLVLEQRLACVVYRNFRQVLGDLDDVPASPGEDVTETRSWVLEQQFLVLDHQIDYAVRAGIPPPPGTWRELHSRYQYFLDWFDGGSVAEPRVGPGGEFDLLPAYKRLLLLGIAAGSVGDELNSEGFAPRLRTWALETGLEAPSAAGFDSGVWVVDPASDGPPHQVLDPLDLGPRCAILTPPPGFLALLRASGTDGAMPAAQ